MKKITFLICLLLMASAAFAQQPSQPPANEPTSQTPAKKMIWTVVPSVEQQKRFKQRNKEIRKLVKQYQKASAEQKLVLKQRLTQLVSEGTDESLSLAKERIASEKENLAQWESKLQEQEQNLDQIKARRVDEILSGEAKIRYKLAKKRWKQEIKDLNKSMK